MMLELDATHVKVRNCKTLFILIAGMTQVAVALFLHAKPISMTILIRIMQ